LGVDGIMITTEFSEAVTQQQMLAHFETIAEQTKLPIWLYHETALSNNNMSIDTLLTIADMPKVVGMKDSGPDLSVGKKIDTLIKKGVSVYNGWEDRIVANLHPLT
jgi:4-hydroxy-tetrahydrodipicolinate synthase